MGSRWETTQGGSQLLGQVQVNSLLSVLIWPSCDLNIYWHLKGYIGALNIEPCRHSKKAGEQSLRKGGIKEDCRRATLLLVFTSLGKIVMPFHHTENIMRVCMILCTRLYGFMMFLSDYRSVRRGWKTCSSVLLYCWIMIFFVNQLFIQKAVIKLVCRAPHHERDAIKKMVSLKVSMTHDDYCCFRGGWHKMAYKDTVFFLLYLSSFYCPWLN